jgi:hypothetical protein
MKTKLSFKLFNPVKSKLTSQVLATVVALFSNAAPAPSNFNNSFYQHW